MQCLFFVRDTRKVIVLNSFPRQKKKIGFLRVFTQVLRPRNIIYEFPRERATLEISKDDMGGQAFREH